MCIAEIYSYKVRMFKGKQRVAGLGEGSGLHQMACFGKSSRGIGTNEV